MAMPVLGTPLPMAASLQTNYGSVGGYTENTGTTWAGEGGSYFFPNSYKNYSMAKLIGLAFLSAAGNWDFDGGGCGTQSASCGGGSCAGYQTLVPNICWNPNRGNPSCGNPGCTRQETYNLVHASLKMPNTTDTT